MTDKKQEDEEVREVDLEDLEQVTGGGAFSNIPRVPEKPIDDQLRDKA